MKILKIELKNINSLKSETEICINFEDDIFQDVGLYAITGATGAGKTTILDAITIALYQEVPRFNKSNIKAGLEDVISYGATDAMCRVTFVNKNIRYDALWEIRLVGKTGKKLAKPSEIVRLQNLDSGKILAEKKTDFKIAIENIIQLTYSQFLRSVLLAQGEFAAFLSANAREKGTLLEQITGEEIYKKIGEAASERKSAENKKLEATQARIQTDDLLSDTDRETLKEEQKQIATELVALLPRSKQIDHRLQWYSDEEKLKVEEIQLKKREDTLREEEEVHKPSMLQLAIHEKAKPFRDLLEEINRTNTSLEGKRIRYKELNAQISNINEQLEISKKDKKLAKDIFEEKEAEQHLWIPKLDRVTKLDANISNISQQKKEVSETLKLRLDTVLKLKKKIEEQTSEAQEAKKLTESLKNELASKKNIISLDTNINHWNTQLTLRKNKKEQIKECIQYIALKEQVSKDLDAEILAKRQQLNDENERIAVLQNEIKNIEEQLAKNDIAKLLDVQENLKDRQEIYVDGLQISKAHHTDSRKKMELELQITKLKKAKNSLSSEIDICIATLDPAKQSLQDAEEMAALHRSIQAFDEERKKLTENEPCPLCGSMDHPYVSTYESIKISDSQKKVADRKRILTGIEDNIQQFKIKIASADTSLKSLGIQLAEITTNLHQLRANFEILEITVDIDNQEGILKTLEAIKTEIRVSMNQIAEIQNIQQQKNTVTTKLTTEKEKINTLKLKIATTHEKLENNTQQLVDKKREQLKNTDAVSQIEKVLTREFVPHQLQLPAIEDTSVFIKTILDTVTEYKEKEKQLEKCSNELSKISIGIANDSKQIIEKTTENKEQSEKITEFETQLQKHASDRNILLPTSISTEHKRKELQDAVLKTKKDAEKTLNALKEWEQQQIAAQKEFELLKKEGELLKIKITTDEKDFLKAIEGTSFFSQHSVADALLSEEDEKRYQSIFRNLENDALKLETLKKQWNIEYTKLKEIKDFEIPLAQVNIDKELLDKEKDAFQEKSGSIRARIDIDDTIRERHQEILVEIAQQKKIVQKWVSLFRILGNSKDAFNTYVQRLTLQNLINRANVHLFKLNKRYMLQMQEHYTTGEELNFMLVDHYQADEVRVVDTSSGGEKFLISLSLALGLSDLASHNVPIHSLFIDEGFGTLDTRTLETVIATLETLQAQGKMIGIISHVENLKERISTQIQVVKKSNGVSEVHIV